MPGGKTINVHLPAVGARGGTRKSLQLGLQFIGVVGESFQILALENHHTGVVGGIDVNPGRRVGHFHLLLFNLNGQANIELLCLSIKDLDTFFCEKSEAFGGSLQRVGTWREALEFVEAVPVRGGVQRPTTRRDQTDGSLCDDAARRVSDHATQTARGRLSIQMRACREDQ